MPIRDGWLSEATTSVRAALDADLLEVIGEQVRGLFGVKHSWAASAKGELITADDSIPLGALVAMGQPLARIGNFLGCSLQGSGQSPEGWVVVKVEQDVELEPALLHFTTVAGFALEAARLRAHLEVVTAARDSLFKSMSHDLRNPLNAFSMGMGLLHVQLERGNLDYERALNLVARMKRSSLRMKALLDDLSDAGRLDAQTLSFSIRPELAAQLIRDAVAAASPSELEKTITVTADALEEGMNVMADRTRTLQLIANVIAFEEKSAGAHGSIRLGVRRVGDSTVFTAHALGVEGKQLVAPSEEGGLALRLARGLTSGQAGELHIEPGEGLTISFTLPNALADSP